MTRSDNPAEVAITYLKGVGPKRATVLKTVGIETVEDLLYYFPRRYLDRSTITPISRLRIGDTTTVVGKVTTQGLLRARRNFYEVLLADETGALPLVWFNGIQYVQNRFKRGMTLSVAGTVTEFRGIQMVHPEIEVIFEDEEEERIHTGRIIPLYPSTEKLKEYFLDSRGFRRIIRTALDQFADQLDDLVPQSLLKEMGVLPLPEAVRQMHYPDEFTKLERARKELAFRELLLFQLQVADRRRRLTHKPKQHTVRAPDEWLRSLARSLPFKLTVSQKKVLSEIIQDLQQPKPMMRLLQGDVGTGKTVVAALAMALVAHSGLQAALMAPTEILAVQHFRTVAEMLSTHAITVALLTGSTPPSERAALIERLGKGEIDILVGTHALITEAVKYKQLGFVVVDEQQRFGVEQREALLAKGHFPDLLVMTATPIPRTLALTAYGDLDLSLMEEAPAGRIPVRSALRTEADRPKIYQFIREEAQRGNRAFVIYPLVEESLQKQLRAAKRAYKELSETIFPDLTLGLVHGQMKKEAREEVMRRFSSGEVAVLVATTVVGVGIDIADATVILIEHPERFGLSQLHQLRGRVGRSNKKSYCILLTDMDQNTESYKRLEQFVSCTDGFAIAELDLELRGPGDLLGKRQSGVPLFRVANLLSDRSLILTTREYADRLLMNELEVTSAERARLNLYIKRRRELEIAGGIS